MTPEKKQHAQIVGFIITPGEIANRIQALDKSIQALGGDVAALKQGSPDSAKLDTGWRVQFNAFLERWAIERDSYATWDSRLFATRVMPRLEAFEQSYRYWARDFQTKSGRKVTVPLMREQEDMTAAVIPSQVWWILAGGMALWILTQSPKLR